MKIKYSLISSLIAGLTTNLGVIFTYLKPKRVEKVIVLALSIAFGVMTLISIKELLPNPIISIFKNYDLFRAISILIFCPLLAYFIIKLSKLQIKKGSNLYKVGVLNMITLLLHNLPEGIAVFMSNISNYNLGLKITLAIAAHNLPEGICIAVPIYYSTNNRKKAFLYTFISGMAEPIGALITFLFLKTFITINILNIILYFIGSLMILISFKEILPEILKYKEKYYMMYGLLLSLLILFL